MGIVVRNPCLHTNLRTTGMMQSALTHVIGPNTEHKYHPDSKVEISKRVDALAERGRQPVPRKLRFVTYTLRYHEMRWLSVQGLESHWDRARVEAEIREPGFFTVRTENVKAFRLNFGPGAARESAAPASVRSEGMEVKAYRVPLGFYEAVVSRGPDCRKHLYGWRYVGFAPFNKCPMESTGLDCTDCNDSHLFGLVSENNTLVFKRIDELAFDTITVSSSSSNSPANDALLILQLQNKINEFLKSRDARPRGGIKAEIDRAARTVTFSSDHPILATAEVNEDLLEQAMQRIVNDILQGYAAVNNTESM